MYWFKLITTYKSITFIEYYVTRWKYFKRVISCRNPEYHIISVIIIMDITFTLKTLA